MKLLLIVLASVTGLAIIAEIGLRLTTGLGNPPLYIADREIGYLLAPNQKLRRFGNTIATNQYSMRSREIEPSSDRIHPSPQGNTKLIEAIAEQLVD